VGVYVCKDDHNYDKLTGGS